jgi:hypothetical protein
MRRSTSKDSLKHWKGRWYRQGVPELAQPRYISDPNQNCCSRGSQLLRSDLPLRLAVSNDLGEDLVSRAQTCGSEFVVVDVDEEEVVA